VPAGLPGQRRRVELPDFPWDTLAPFKARAAAHPDGLVDLSMGTPVDPVPLAVQRALAEAANAPGYPATAGTPTLQAAMLAYVVRRCAAVGLPPAGVLPTIGSKELISWLPTMLGLGPGDVVAIPPVCYPTYEVGARLAGAEVVRTDSVVSLGPSRRVGLIWLNSPGNPHGRVLPPEHLRKVVDWARDHGAVVASDECYLELCWDAEPVSVLDARVRGSSFEAVLAVHSLSKRSNLAGYRAGFVAGDPAVVSRLLEVRKHAGMMLPAPVQAAMVAALVDRVHVAEQRDRYASRRTALREALLATGFTIDHSEAGLYLWATRGEDCWSTVEWLATRGILVAPGAFYGPTGDRHVRFALTATDQRVAAAVTRLTG
jgi:succinyldiaminopimelate transaminase